MTNPFSILSSYKHSNQTQGDYNSWQDCGISILDKGKQKQLSGMPDWGDIDSFCNEFGFHQENPVWDLLIRPKDQEILGKNDKQMSDDPGAEYLPDKQISQLNEVMPSSFFSEPRAFVSSSNGERVICADHGGQKLWTELILRLAGERFLQFSSQKFINITMFEHPYSSSLSGLCMEDKQDVELAQLLLAAAEKVDCHQYETARKLLHNCQWISSNAGTPVQRVVSYFSEALMVKIKKETGHSEEKRIADEACRKKNILALTAMHRELPFFQIEHFTAVQAILENIRTKSSKVHLIDFQVLIGLHWAAFMQAIAEQKMESCYLKITAIETVDESGAEKTGKVLRSFARYLNLSFSYKVVFLPDIKDLKEEHFDIEADETVAVYFHFVLRTLISKPICLKHLMTITQKIKPSVVVVSEIEANHNSPSFVNRFIEALFSYGVIFDSLEESMARENKERMAIESGIFRDGMHNIVGSEGHERVTRSVSISVWRAFFARFGMTELAQRLCIKLSLL